MNRECLFKLETIRQIEDSIASAETLDSVYTRYRDGSLEQRALLGQIRGYLHNTRTKLRTMHDIARRIGWLNNANRFETYRLEAAIDHMDRQLGLLLTGREPSVLLNRYWLTHSAQRIAEEMHRIGLMDPDEDSDEDPDDGVPDYGRGERAPRTQAMRDRSAEALVLNELLLTLENNAFQAVRLMGRLSATGPPVLPDTPITDNPFLVIQNPGDDETDWLQFARPAVPEWVNAPMVRLSDPGFLDNPMIRVGDPE